MEMPSNDKQWTLPVLSKYIKKTGLILIRLSQMGSEK